MVACSFPFVHYICITSYQLYVGLITQLVFLFAQSLCFNPTSKTIYFSPYTYINIIYLKIYIIKYIFNLVYFS